MILDGQLKDHITDMTLLEITTILPDIAPILPDIAPISPDIAPISPDIARLRVVSPHIA